MNKNTKNTTLLSKSFKLLFSISSFSPKKHLPLLHISLFYNIPYIYKFYTPLKKWMFFCGTYFPLLFRIANSIYFKKTYCLFFNLFSSRLVKFRVLRLAYNYLVSALRFLCYHKFYLATYQICVKLSCVSTFARICCLRSY